MKEAEAKEILEELFTLGRSVLERKDITEKEILAAAAVIVADNIEDNEEPNLTEEEHDAYHQHIADFQMSVSILTYLAQWGIPNEEE